MSDTFDAALEALDFGRAEALLAAADAATQSSLRRRLAEQRAEAEKEARLLASEIQRLARDNRFIDLLAIDRHPRTAALLQLLPNELARGSEVQLEGARKWREQRMVATKRHLQRAQEAVALYDTARSRAELLKVDEQYLDEEELALARRLQDQIDAAEVERLELELRTRDVLAEHEENVKGKRLRILLSWGAIIVAVVIVAVLSRL